MLLNMNRITVFACILFSFLNVSTTTAQKLDTVKITVYYDASNNQSFDFITKQLSPSYEFIANRIILQLVPYCLAPNMAPNSNNYRAIAFHVCGLCQTEDQQTQLHYVTCLMNYGLDIKETNVETCATSLNLPYDTIKRCFDSTEGTQRIENNGYATRAVNPPISFLPAIANNGWVNAALQFKALNNFLDYVCSFLNNPPEKCVK